MKKQNGFSAVIVLVIITALSVIAASGYLVYKENTKDNDNSAASKTNQTTTKKSTGSSNSTETKPNYTIRYINAADADATLILYTESDLATLPSDFPKGAIELMRKNIGNSIDPTDPTSCKQVYSVHKYNDINVLGGDFAVDSAKKACPGGAMAVLSIDANGSWVVNGFQAVHECSLIVEAKIYKEFIEQCYSKQNADGSSSQEDIFSNPNGNSTEL